MLSQLHGAWCSEQSSWIFSLTASSSRLTHASLEWDGATLHYSTLIYSCWYIKWKAIHSVRTRPFFLVFLHPHSVHHTPNIKDQTYIETCSPKTGCQAQRHGIDIKPRIISTTIVRTGILVTSTKSINTVRELWPNILLPVRLRTPALGMSYSWKQERSWGFIFFVLIFVYFVSYFYNFIFWFFLGCHLVFVEKGKCVCLCVCV